MGSTRRRSGRRGGRRRRSLLLTLVAAVAAVVVIGAYLASSGGGGIESYVDEPVSQPLMTALQDAAGQPYGQSDPSLGQTLRAYGGPPISEGGKPIVVYLGADYCPYCAAQRWSLILALMRFGSFSGLYYMASSPTDVFPNTPTFTFSHSSYVSDYVTFQAYESEDRAGQPLQSVPSNYSSISRQFGGSIPFIDIGNRYVAIGASFSPSLLAGKNWTTIASSVQADQGEGVQIKQGANVLTAAVCKLTDNRPQSVCLDGSIAGLVSFSPPASSPSISLMTGTPSRNATAWATVQYGQTAWTRKTSM